MSQDTMDHLKRLANAVDTLLWITGAKVYGSCTKPNLALVNGLSRTLMMERPSLRFAVLDIGLNLTVNNPKTCHNIAKALRTVQDNDDAEFMQLHGLLHINRFIPDGHRNSLFRRRVGQDSTTTMQLEAAGLVQLALDRAGAMDTLHFKQVRDPGVNLPAGFVDVRVQAMGINAKDVSVLNGRVETTGGTIALEFSGLVEAVGAGVEHVKVGDRVAVLAPNHFYSTERVPDWAVHTMDADEDYTTMASILVSYATALYALQDRANLKAGESVLIHAGAGALGMAAITVAQRIGAIVYSTISSSVKSSYLVDQLGVPKSHIFNSRSPSFASDVMEATGGKGVDVILNSLTGDLLHAGWDCIASFGRFVEVGKRDLVDSGLLQMHTFLKNTTFPAFDLADLYLHGHQAYRDILRNKLKETLSLYRQGHIKPPPITVVDVSEISRAYRPFSTKDRIGKIVISLENPKSLISVSPSNYSTIFDSEKVYLLVGCLGGLGRSLSLWMLHRGARHFVYLSRTGDAHSKAKSFTAQLRSLGATVEVVCGDVTSSTDVSTAVEVCEATGRSLGGIVQAAMALQASLFGQMTSEAWHKVFAAKQVGTWNLHHALEAHQPDFLFLMSSISGSLGSATESNYCAANSFLDAFARWRCSRGRRTVSLGLGIMSEVGFLHENPDANALISRKGTRPLSEDDFFQMIDLALSYGHARDGSESFPEANVLTGLEPANLQGTVWHDPRMGILRLARSGQKPGESVLVPVSVPSEGVRVSAASSNSWLKSVPADVQKVLVDEANSSTLSLAVRKLVRKQLSKLIFIPVDQISEQESMGDYGIDSLIGSEFRSWLWTTFKVEVSSFDIISSHKTLGAFADSVASELTGRA